MDDPLELLEGRLMERLDAIEQTTDLLSGIAMHQMRGSPARTVLLGSAFGWPGMITKMYDGHLLDGTILALPFGAALKDVNATNDSELVEMALSEYGDEVLSIGGGHAILRVCLGCHHRCPLTRAVTVLKELMELAELRPPVLGCTLEIKRIPHAVLPLVVGADGAFLDDNGRKAAWAELDATGRAAIDRHRLRLFAGQTAHDLEFVSFHQLNELSLERFGDAPRGG